VPGGCSANALTRALFVCGPQDNRWMMPQFEMDAPENFASILPINAAKLIHSRNQADKP
jgi:hypothetical protein